MGWKIGLANALLSGGFFVFLEFLIKRHDRKKANEFDPKVLKNLMLASGAIIQDRIVALSRMHLKRGEICVQDKEELWQIVDPYFKAGFNHLGKEYWQAVDKLPVVENCEEAAEENTH